jgi:uncharacterized protein (TIGR03083 family)
MPTTSEPDLSRLLQAESDRLAGALTSLPPEAWATPSLCAGWTVRDVLAHLCMPYDLSVRGLLPRLVAARFSFDRAALTWAIRDPRDGPTLAQAVQMLPERRFGVPGAPAEAPLSHLVCHAGDVLRPLGLPHEVAPDAGAIVLEELVTRGRKTLPAEVVGGWRWVAEDARWTHGEGPEVCGPAAALVTTLLGRSAALSDLSGEGAEALRARFR